MGFLCLQAAWGIQEGIGVDTHVRDMHFHRLRRLIRALGTSHNKSSWMAQEIDH